MILLNAEANREKELFEVYRQIAETMGDKPVIIRTVDIGMDKLAFCKEQLTVNKIFSFKITKLLRVK